jgi:hypothetical protein
MHDDRQQEVVCIQPADWSAIRRLAEWAGGARVGQDWQPIETAPANANFLVAVDDTVMSAYSQNGEIKAEYSLRPFATRPTHWMPLPAAPTPETQG